jgi:CRISPR type I-E-associated protein CasB/Cse2
MDNDERPSFGQVIDGLIGEFHKISPTGSTHIDRKTVSQLRQAWGSEPPWESPEIIPTVAPFIDGISRRQRKVVCLVAMLFGINPSNSKAVVGDFGASVHRHLGLDATESSERDFLSILDCHSLEDIYHPLAGWVDRLANGCVPINWKALAWDLLKWSEDGQMGQREIKLKWSNSYYSSKSRTIAAAAKNKEQTT